MQLTQVPVKELARLRAERQQAIDALRFYAERENYENLTPRTVRAVIQDDGYRARAALVKLGEKP